MFSSASRKQRQRSSPGSRRRRLRQELLERRDLLALDVAFENGSLDIRATDFDDIIVSADQASDGSAYVKVNGLDPNSGPILAAEVEQIQAIGGLLSFIDLSSARENDAAFSSLRKTVESEPDDRWLIDSVQPLDVLDEIYIDPIARSLGLSLVEKKERIYLWANARENFPRSTPWVQYADNTDLPPIEYDQLLDALPFFQQPEGAANDDGGIVDITNLVEQHEYVDWMSFTVDHHATPGSSDRFAFNGMTVDFNVSDGTATSPEDYDPQATPNEPLEWLDGEEGQNRAISIDIEQDNIWEEDEDLNVTLTGVQNFSGDEGQASLGNSQGTGVILNDDPEPTASIVSTETVDEDEGTVKIGVSLSNPSSVPVTVQWSTKDDTATLGDDFSGASGSIVFAPLDTYEEIVITIFSDALDEYDEIFSICLDGATNGSVSSSAYESHVTIYDDDLPPGISISDASGNEDSMANSLSFTVTLDAPSGKTVTVNYATQDGTAKDGLDYTGVTGQLTFAPGETANGFSVTIIDDLLAEDPENMFGILSLPTNAIIIDGQGEGIIYSDDADPIVSIDDVAVVEGNPGDGVVAVFTIVLSGPSGRPIEVTASTSNGTALAGEDYESTTDTFVFGLDAAGHQTAQPLYAEFSVPIIEDLVAEQTEVFFVDLINAVNTGPGDLSGNGTITDDDPVVDLDAATVFYNLVSGELPDAIEETEGAYVPLNNDDDDYDSFNTEDVFQVGAINGENDLLPLILHEASINVPNAKYMLTIPSHIRIWQNSDRSGAITSLTQFDANVETTVYAEGFSFGSGLVEINWTDGTNTINNADRVNVNVFELSGPLNVPGHAIYEYTAFGGHDLDGAWIAPFFGVDTANTNTGAGGVDSIDILWSGGPGVGGANYQASTNYTWQLDVNIVEIEITGTVNQLTYGQSVEQFGLSGLIESGIVGTDPGMGIVLDVRIEGPTVGGSMRGVKFMEMGFIQNAQIDKLRGNFPAFSPARARVSSVETAGLLLDTLTAADVPWYHRDPASFLAPTVDASLTWQFSTSDTPALTVSDVSVLSGDGLTDIPIQSGQLIVDFSIYFAVRTTDNRNNADDTYTQRTTAAWQFDGSGGFGGASVNNFGVWLPTGNGNTGDASSIIVTNGDRVPVTSGTRAIVAVQSATWSTVPPF